MQRRRRYSANYREDLLSLWVQLSKIEDWKVLLFMHQAGLMQATGLLWVIIGVTRLLGGWEAVGRYFLKLEQTDPSTIRLLMAQTRGHMLSGHLDYSPEEHVGGFDQSEIDLIATWVHNENLKVGDWMGRS